MLDAIVLAVMVLAGPGARPAGAPGEVVISKDLQVRELAPGVWMHTSWGLAYGQRFPSNGLLVEDEGGLLLVDTAWGEEPTEALLKWLERDGRRVTRAIATHGHDDRVGGAAALARRGLKVERLPELAAPGDARRVGPVEVLNPGPAHTKDNLVVWVSGARLLFGGCAVKSADAKGLGNVADADVAAWPAAVTRMQEQYWQAKIVVPGHGAPGGLDLLEHTQALLKKP